MYAGIIFGSLSLLFALLVGLVLTVFWILMLVDAIRNKGLSDGEKVGWVLAIVFLHLLGAVLYYFIGRPKQRISQPV